MQIKSETKKAKSDLNLSDFDLLENWNSKYGAGKGKMKLSISNMIEILI